MLAAVPVGVPVAVLVRPSYSKSTLTRYLVTAVILLDQADQVVAGVDTDDLRRKDVTTMLKLMLLPRLWILLNLSGSLLHSLSLPGSGSLDSLRRWFRDRCGF